MGVWCQSGRLLPRTPSELCCASFVVRGVAICWPLVVILRETVCWLLRCVPFVAACWPHVAVVVVVEWLETLRGAEAEARVEWSIDQSNSQSVAESAILEQRWSVQFAFTQKS